MLGESSSGKDLHTVLHNECLRKVRIVSLPSIYNTAVAIAYAESSDAASCYLPFQMALRCVYSHQLGNGVAAANALPLCASRDPESSMCDNRSRDSRISCPECAFWRVDCQYLSVSSLLWRCIWRTLARTALRNTVGRLDSQMIVLIAMTM
jgi:hypothetical protein